MAVEQDMGNHRKRARVSACSHSLIWRARRSGTRYCVVFSRPDVDEVQLFFAERMGPFFSTTDGSAFVFVSPQPCVISGDSIQDARLDWLADDIDAFFPEDRTLKKATLPCQHSFAATPLAYHFLKNSMRCPVCRSGEDNQLDSRIIPPALRSVLLARVRETTATEAAQQQAEDHAATLLEIQRVILSELVFIHEPFIAR
jgi:hypothetical protein